MLCFQFVCILSAGLMTKLWANFRDIWKEQNALEQETVTISYWRGLICIRHLVISLEMIGRPS